MKIRVFQPNDADAVAALWVKELNEGSPHNDPARVINDKLAHQPELFFVGHAGDRLVATCMAGYDGHRGWLYCVAVDPEQQGQGFGRQIVQHAISALKQLDCAKINLQIRADNLKVESFYNDLGFVTEARISMGMVV